MPVRSPIVSSYGWTRQAWLASADVVHTEESRTPRWWRVVSAAREHRVVVLDGFERGDLVAAAVIARRRRPPHVVILDPTWKLDGNRLLRWLTRASVRSFDGAHVTYCVLSRFETAAFPSTWGVDPDRVGFLPWHYDLSDDELAAPTSTSGPFFAGGDSLRDYRTLLEAARGVPAPVVVATNVATRAIGARIADNVDLGPRTRPEYDRLQRDARAVVLPLAERKDRSSGQGTLLNAMAHGKTVIVTDVPGIRDYVRPGETALVVPCRDPAALAAAMTWVLQHPSDAERVGHQAREDVLGRFGPDVFLERVLAECDRLLR